MIRERKKESEKEALKILIYIFCEGKNDEQYLTKITSFINEKFKNNGRRSDKKEYEIILKRNITNEKEFESIFKKLSNDSKVKIYRAYWFFDIDFKEDRHKWINKQDDNVNYCRVNPCLEFLLLLHKYNNKSEIDKELNEWQTNIDIATQWIQPKDWFVRRGQAVDDAIWAGLAYLFDLRASMFETKIVEALAKDMKVEPLLAKERIRKLRDKGFLGVAGKGNFAEGRLTKSAMEILIERGMMNAEKSK
jgi:hypothetical protein